MEENKYSKEDLDNQKKVEQSEMSIKAILQDQLRALKEMVGTKTESVDLSKEVLSLHRETNQFTYYTHNKNDANSISTNNVKSIIKTKKGNLWIGTHDGGLNFLNPNKN